MSVKFIFLYWYTLKYLKPVQFFGRIKHCLYRSSPRFLEGHATFSVATGKWVPTISKRPTMIGQSTFCFLNHTKMMSSHHGWNDEGMDKLWLYNLHYFDDLNAMNSKQRAPWHAALIIRWLSENKPASGVGWEAYPTSLRIVNWLKWIASNNAPAPGMLESLVVQALWLERKLEWHLLGNHLFVNAKALIFAGLFIDSPYSDRWLEKGLKIIDKELREQVLEDGGNYERSTMYHAIFLEDLFDLINASEYFSGRISIERVSYWRTQAKKMLVWSCAMSHPDGDIALFNDAAFNIAPTLSGLLDYASRLGCLDLLGSDDRKVPSELTHFRQSGYIRLEVENAVAILDVAPIGPDYLPGHAHADTLSFELSVFGHRLVVNGGTSSYANGAVRMRERGTASHSTVQIDEYDSSEVWSGFRVARRAYPFDLWISELPNLHIACSHDGYMRLSGSPVHRREWVMTSESLIVSDQVTGGDYDAKARYILHPDVDVIVCGENEFSMKLPGGKIIIFKVLTGIANVESFDYAPEFGVVIKTKCMVIDLIGGYSNIQFTWNPLEKVVNA